MIPEYTKESLDNWVAHGWEPGGFGMAVLENNLSQAVGRADSTNLAALLDIVRYVYNDIPSACWGSPEKCRAWRARFSREEDLEVET